MLNDVDVPAAQLDWQLRLATKRLVSLARRIQHLAVLREKTVGGRGGKVGPRAPDTLRVVEEHVRSAYRRLHGAVEDK